MGHWSGSALPQAPVKRKGDMLCSGSVPSCPKLQAGWVLYEAVNRQGNTHTMLVCRTGPVLAMLAALLLLHGTDEDW